MGEAEILGGQQVFARRVRLEDMVLVAVEELPLALEGIVQVLLCTGRRGAVRYRAAVPCAAGPDAGGQRTGPRHPGADAGTAFSGAGPLTPKAQTLLFPEWCLCFLYARTSNPAKRNLMSAIKIFEHFYHKKFINVAILPHTTYYFNFVKCNEIYKFHNAIYT